jgi:CheY-like chemotaxis protein
MATALTKKRFMSFEPTILFAEDSESDAFLMQLAFEDAGLPFALQFVPDGLAATNYLSGKAEYADREKHPFPCILLTDLKMPRMTGFELLRWVRADQQSRHLPVIVVSGSDQPEDRQRALALGANDYVVKDLVLRPESALFQALLRHAPVPCGIAAKPVSKRARKVR